MKYKLAFILLFAAQLFAQDSLGIYDSLTIDSNWVGQSITFVGYDYEYKIPFRDDSITVNIWSYNGDLALLLFHISYFGEEYYNSLEKYGIYLSDDLNEQIKAVFRKEKLLGRVK